MATNYPAALDSFTNPAAGDSLASPSHAGQHTNINDAMEAVQAALGTDPKGAAADVSARIAALEGGGGDALPVKLLPYSSSRTRTSQTLLDDETLVISLPSAGVYRIKAHIQWKDSGTPKCRWHFSAAVLTSLWGVDSGGVRDTVSAPSRVTVSAADSTDSNTVTPGVYPVRDIHLIADVSGACNLSLQWASNDGNSAGFYTASLEVTAHTP